MVDMVPSKHICHITSNNFVYEGTLGGRLPGYNGTESTIGTILSFRTNWTMNRQISNANNEKLEEEERNSEDYKSLYFDSLVIYKNHQGQLIKCISLGFQKCSGVLASTISKIVGSWERIFLKENYKTKPNRELGF